MVKVTVDGSKEFIADAAIITVPLGVLKANLIQFEPKLPDWKMSAISDLGVGNENKIALRFSEVFWPDVELLGMVAPNSFACGYFLNLHKAIGDPVLVYMIAGRCAYDLEKLSDEAAVKFVMLQIKKMFPNASDPVSYLFILLCLLLFFLFFFISFHVKSFIVSGLRAYLILMSLHCLFMSFATSQHLVF